MVQITGKTQLIGVIGSPIKHSLSPLMHNAAIAHLKLDLAYVPFLIKPEKLREAIAGFEAINLLGFNITIPHKQAILPYLNGISDTAAAIGAVNTVWHDRQGWQGTNTDVEGFVSPLRTLGRDWAGTVAVVLGNGGAARAVVAGCASLGCAEIHVLGRSPAKLENFADSWSGSPWAKSLRVHPWEEAASLLPYADLLVNTTPVGMAPQTDASPLEVLVMDGLKPGAIAYDLIYVPNPTRFLSLAQARGAVAIDGLEMLIQQGAAALKIWTGRDEVPVRIMRDCLKLKLKLA